MGIFEPCVNNLAAIDELYQCLRLFKDPRRQLEKDNIGIQNEISKFAIFRNGEGIFENGKCQC